MSEAERRDKVYTLRIPPELYEELEKWAAEELRSVNSLMVLLLKKAVAKKAEKGDTEENQNAELVGLAT